MDLFIPYEEALALKELGFDEECVGYYDGQNIPMIKATKHCVISAPLYQQAFDWFYDEYGYHCTFPRDSYGCRYEIKQFKGRDIIEIEPDRQYAGLGMETVRENCLKKLIELEKK